MAHWVILKPGDAPVMECRRCEATDTLHLPLSLTVFVAALAAFDKEHSSCRETIRG